MQADIGKFLDKDLLVNSVTNSSQVREMIECLATVSSKRNSQILSISSSILLVTIQPELTS